MSEDFLSRWSRRKQQARAAPPAPSAEKPPAAPPPPAAAAAVPAADGAPPAAPPLPPVEGLSFESDFTPFMQAGVDAVLRREALKKLLNDPRFNVMDGLDVYIDDYSKPDPLPEGWLEMLTKNARFGDHAETERREREAAAAAAAAEAEREASGAQAAAPQGSDTPDAEPPPAQLPESPSQA